jgi:DNA-binding PadR family transcriptional regulator
LAGGVWGGLRPPPQPNCKATRTLSYCERLYLMRSVARLLVLGVVRMHGQTHGYRAYRELQSWRVEAWADVKPGSVYHALNQLTKQGVLRPVVVEGSRQGPSRTVFEMTEDGEAEFQHLLGEALASPDMEFLSAGLIFIQALPRAHAIDLLGQRLRQVEAIRDDLRATLPASRNAWPSSEYAWEPAGHPELANLWITSLEHAATWTASLIARLEAGAYRMAGDPPPLADA